MKMRTPLLFDVPRVRPSMAQRITEFKRRQNIFTHRAISKGRSKDVWCALKLRDGETRNAMQVIAEECYILEDVGRLVSAPGELSAIRKLCQNVGIPCDL